MKKIIVLATLLLAVSAFASEDRTAYLKEHARALQLESQILKQNTQIRQKELQDEYDKTMAELKPILEAEKKAKSAAMDKATNEIVKDSQKKAAEEKKKEKK